VLGLVLSVSGARARGVTPMQNVEQTEIVALDAGTGVRESGFPQVRAGSSVYAFVSDGRGGWFVGGSFRAIGGVASHGLAHVLADKSVDKSWQFALSGCYRNPRIHALIRQGTTLYVGDASIESLGRRGVG
jgi:hypothetical protein